jgi:hypothetical protein
MHNGLDICSNTYNTDAEEQHLNVIRNLRMHFINGLIGVQIQTHGEMSSFVYPHVEGERRERREGGRNQIQHRSGISKTSSKRTQTKIYTALNINTEGEGGEPDSIEQELNIEKRSNVKKQHVVVRSGRRSPPERQLQ